MRWWGQTAMVSVALVLTVANSGAPPMRMVTRSEGQSGALQLTVEPRLYRDKPLELILPAGVKYRRVTVTEVTPPPDPEAAPARASELPPAPRLQLDVVAPDWRLLPTHPGDAVRIALPLQGAGDDRALLAHGDRRFRVRAEAADGRTGALTFTLEAVTR